MNEQQADTVLVVEDEPKIARLLIDYLEQAGFRTHWIANGVDVVGWVQQSSPDLVLLDLMLPGKDGTSICRELRQFSDVPIIMITARVDEIDRLLGLELGADDYLCKPFSPREVVARVKAILRRANRPIAEPASVHGIAMDEAAYTTTVGRVRLELTPVEFRLLSCFVKHPRRVFSRAQLMDQVYLDSRVVSDRTVDTHVKNLRKKLSTALPEDPIRSVYGVGYKLE